MEPDPRITMMVGAFGKEKQGSSPEVEAAVEAVKAKLEDERSEKYVSFDVISFREQTVAGRNYYINVRAKTSGGNDRNIRLKVHRDLKGVHQLLESKLMVPAADSKV